jgi:hypothetical protein
MLQSEHGESRLFAVCSRNEVFHCPILPLVENERDAGQPQVIFSQMYNLLAWDLDCDITLNTYQVNVF